MAKRQQQNQPADDNDQDPLLNETVSLGSAFLFGGTVNPASIIDDYKGPRQRHGFSLKGKEAGQRLKPEAVPVPTSAALARPRGHGRTPISTPAPAPAFQRSAQIIPSKKADHKPVVTTPPPAVNPADLPDLTNAYLEKLIGWQREYEGTNPRENLKHVWIKTELGSFYPSPIESWANIGYAIKHRTRNVETTARDLQSHIREMRVPLTKARLDQLLDWYEEKTGKPLKKNSVVWLKDDTQEDAYKWSIAPFRWNEVEREFNFADVRAELGAESLDHYKRLRHAARIDAIVFAHGPLPAGPRR